MRTKPRVALPLPVAAPSSSWLARESRRSSRHSSSHLRLFRAVMLARTPSSGLRRSLLGARGTVQRTHARKTRG